MSSFVDKLVDKQINLLTNDGRVFTGILKSFDQRMNIIVGDCIENVFMGEGQDMEEEELGVYFVRGDNIAMIGQVEAGLQQEAKQSGQLRGDPLPSMHLH